MRIVTLISFVLLGVVSSSTETDIVVNSFHRFSRAATCCSDIESKCATACVGQKCELKCGGKCGADKTQLTQCGPYTCSSVTKQCSSPDICSPASAPGTVVDGPPLDTLFTESGIVPDFLDTAPEKLITASWDSGLKLSSTNQTVDTGDILHAPSVTFSGSYSSLYTIMIVDFGQNYDGANIVHWMVSNVPHSGDISSGDENIEYLPPFSMEVNPAVPEIVNTGDAGIDQTAILAFRQPGQITVEENLTGCNQAAIFGRRIDVSSLITKYNLSGPEAGNLFWTKYSDATDELLCYSTKCTGTPFPFPIPGLTDQPECSQ